MEDRFEIYRRHYSDVARSQEPLNDGAVILEASAWHQFMDPSSRVALDPVDLKELGIQKSQTCEEIVQNLRQRLSGEGILFLTRWTRNYLKAVKEKGAVLDDLQELRQEASKHARIALHQVLGMCEEHIADKSKPQPLPPPKQGLEWLWEWFRGK